jgi:Transglycosylase SLT domain
VLSSLQKLPYGFVAALSGVMAFPMPAHGADGTETQSAIESGAASASTGAGATGPANDPLANDVPASAAAQDQSSSDGVADSHGVADGHGVADEDGVADSDGDAQADSCLVKTICSVKQKIRWQTPAWSPSQCQRIAGAVASSAKRHDLSPTLLLAVMINESDMNEKAQRVYVRAGKVYAKDGGLMAIRCIVDRKDHCVNGNVRGMAWKDIMDPVTNIEVGARELAYWRDGGGVARTVVNRRDEQGHMQQVTKDGPCHHLTHAWWAHYNHGPRYIDKGYPRHYPHRIAVLDHALATVMNIDPPELKHRITIHDPGKRERTVDRPLEHRFKKLYNQILSSGSCSALALN